jgi:hypothetical protein
VTSQYEIALTNSNNLVTTVKLTRHKLEIK